jgi:hypothetical protein
MVDCMGMNRLISQSRTPTTSNARTTFTSGISSLRFTEITQDLNYTFNANYGRAFSDELCDVWADFDGDELLSADLSDGSPVPGA